MLQCLLLPQSFCWHRNGFPSLWALPLATITISVMPPLKSFFWGAKISPNQQMFRNQSPIHAKASKTPTLQHFWDCLTMLQGSQRVKHPAA